MPDVPSQDPDAVIEAESLDRSTPDYALQAASQRIWLRWIAVIAAGTVIIAYGVLEWRLLQYLLECQTEISDLFILLAIAPLLGITIIIVFVLLGVFRGFKESDAHHFPTEAASKALIGGS